MILSIRNDEADKLARKLAEMNGSTKTDAVILALREAIQRRIRQEAPRETARRILEKRGLVFQRNRKAVPPDAYHDLDDDLTGSE